MTVNFRGFRACSCLAKWLPAYEAELKRRGLIKSSIDIYQLIGGAAASAGTHRTGGAFDIAQSGEAIAVARQMGADATWRRRKSQGFDMDHTHGVLRGCDHNTAARYQIIAVDAGYNGLGAGGRGGRDDGPRPLSKRTWQQGIAWAKAQAKASAKAKKVKPWFNISFQNTHWNSIPGGKAVAVAKTTAPLVNVSTAGRPAIATFSEVRESQLGTLSKAMNADGYFRAAYSKSNMTAVYAREDVKVLGQSFAKFTQQDGGNVEGVLRVKFRVDGSRAQVGVLHLDVDSSEAKKKSNLTEAYKAMRRFGIATLLPDWKSRTVIIGDFNDPDVAAKTLKPLGFKQLDTGDARIDQAWVGAKRPDRGGAATDSVSDHPRVVCRLGRY